MYTVKELIEALKQCPENYQVIALNNELKSIESVGIDNNSKMVNLFLKGVNDA